MWNLKKDTNEPIYKTETDSQTSKTKLQLLKATGVGEEWTGDLGLGDANYCIWNGWATGTCCVGQGMLLDVM